MTASLLPAPPSVAGEPAVRLLREQLPEAVLRDEVAFGEATAWLATDRLVEACLLLRDHPRARYALPVFVTAVDYPDREPHAPRFDVVYQLRSLLLNDVCRLIVQVPEESPVVPTLSRHLPGMDWHEREAFDLLGIVFEGHHDLRRILLPEDWDGHPLRRDYVSFGEPVAFTHNREWALPAQERPRDMPGSHR